MREKRKQRLARHLTVLTKEIGERSVRRPQNLHRAASYIARCYQEMGLAVEYQPYRYRDFEVANVICRVDLAQRPRRRYVLGAHYDSVWGTVGADDNASSIAVQLETARELVHWRQTNRASLQVDLVSFALEEPPAYGSRYMGSKVYAKRARRTKERLDGMICLEMVGYTCRRPGCQSYPFPLGLMGYPEQGDFIGIVGNLRSRPLTRRLYQAFKRNSRLPVVPLTVPLGGWLLPAVRLSDHASFWDQGYPAVMVTDSAFYRNPNYHQAADTMETLDLDFMAELVHSLLLFFTADQP